MKPKHGIVLSFLAFLPVNTIAESAENYLSKSKMSSKITDASIMNSTALAPRELTGGRALRPEHHFITGEPLAEKETLKWLLTAPYESVVHTLSLKQGTVPYSFLQIARIAPEEDRGSVLELKKFVAKNIGSNNTSLGWNVIRQKLKLPSIKPQPAQSMHEPADQVLIRASSTEGQCLKVILSIIDSDGSFTISRLEHAFGANSNVELWLAFKRLSDLQFVRRIWRNEVYYSLSVAAERILAAWGCDISRLRKDVYRGVGKNISVDSQQKGILSDIEEQIIDLHNQKMKHSAIARKLGIQDVKAVENILSRASLKLKRAA